MTISKNFDFAKAAVLAIVMIVNWNQMMDNGNSDLSLTVGTKQVANTNFLVGQRIKKRRLELGMSQQNVANLINVSFQQMQKYEKGQNSLSATRLYQLANVLKVSIEYFFDSEEITTTPRIYTIQPTMENGAIEEELLLLMRAFRNISNKGVRKKLADLVRGLIG